nr:unnamed protein product [Naegleria fowleri]
MQELKQYQEKVNEEKARLQSEFESNLQNYQQTSQRTITDLTTRLEQVINENRLHVTALTSKEEMMVSSQIDSQQKISEYRETVEQLNHQLRNTSVELQQKENEISKLRKLMEQLEKDKRALEVVILEKTDLIVRHEMSISNLEIEKKKSSFEISEYSARLSKLEQKTKELLSDISQLQDVNQSLQESNEVLNQQLHSKDADMKQMFELKTKENESLINRVKSDLENQLLDLQQEKANLQQRYDNLIEEKDSLQFNAQQQLETIHRITEELKQSQNENNSLKTELNALKETLVAKVNTHKEFQEKTEKKIEELSNLIVVKTECANAHILEIDKLKGEIQSLQGKLSEIQLHFKKQKDTIKDLTESLNMLNEKFTTTQQELQIKNEAIIHLNAEVEKFRDSVHDKEQQLQTLKKHALTDLEKQIIEKSEALDNQKKIYEQDIFMVKSHLSETKKLFEAKVSLIVDLEERISSLKNETLEKDKEISRWIGSCEDLKKTFEEERKQLSSKIAQLEEVIMSSKEKLLQLEKEKLQLEEEVSSKNSSMKLHEQKISQLERLIEEARTEIKQKNVELEETNALYQEKSEILSKTLEAREKEIEALKTQLLFSESNYRLLEGNKNQLEEDLSQLHEQEHNLTAMIHEKEQIILDLQLQIEALQHDLTQKINANSELSKTLSELKDTNEKMDNFIITLTNEIKDKSLLIQRLERRILENTNEIKQLTEDKERIISSLEKKVALLEKDVSDKQEDVNRLVTLNEKQKKHYTKIVNELESNLEEKENREKLLSGSFNEHSVKLSEYSRKIEAMESQKRQLMNDIEKLENEAHEKGQEILELTEKNHSLQGRVEEMDKRIMQLEKQRKQQQHDFSTLESKMEEDAAKMKQLSKECLDLKQQLTTLEGELSLSKHKLSVSEKSNNEISHELDVCHEKISLLEQEFKLLKSSSKKEKEELETQMKRQIQEHEETIKQLKSQLLLENKLKEELEHTKDLIQNTSNLVEEQNDEVQSLEKELSQHSSLIDRMKEDSEQRIAEITFSCQQHVQELESKERELIELRQNYQKLENMFFQMEKDYRTLQTQDDLINKQLEEKCTELQNRLDETIDPISNREQELKFLMKENSELREQIQEQKNSTDRMQQEIERLLEQLTSNSSISTSPSMSMTDTSSILSTSLLSSTSLQGSFVSGVVNTTGATTTTSVASTTTSSTRQTQQPKTTQSPKKTQHMMQSATLDLKHLWKQLRAEIIRLKQKNVELAQQIMQVQKSKEETIVKYEKQIKSTFIDLMHYKKVAEEVEQLKLDNTRLSLAKKEVEDNLSKLGAKLSALETEKQNLWKLQEQTRKELINLKENVIKLTEENEKLSKMEIRASNQTNIEIEKLKKEKRSLEEKLLSVTDSSKSQKEITQLTNKLKEARTTREKLEKLLREQRLQIEEMDTKNRELRLKITSLENCTSNTNK